MDIKRQAVHGYVTKGFTYRQLAIEYGSNRSAINIWVIVHEGNLDYYVAKKSLPHNAHCSTFSRLKEKHYRFLSLFRNRIIYMLPLSIRIKKVKAK